MTISGNTGHPQHPSQVPLSHKQPHTRVGDRSLLGGARGTFPIFNQVPPSLFPPSLSPCLPWEQTDFLRTMGQRGCWSRLPG